MAGQYFINAGRRTATNVPWLREANPDTLVPSLENRPQTANIPTLPAFGGVEVLRGGPTPRERTPGEMASFSTFAGSKEAKLADLQAPALKAEAESRDQLLFNRQLELSKSRYEAPADIKAKATIAASENALKAQQARAGAVISAAEIRALMDDKIATREEENKMLAQSKDLASKEKLAANTILNEMDKLAKTGKVIGSPEYNTVVEDGIRMAAQKEGADLDKIGLKMFSDMSNNEKSTDTPDVVYAKTKLMFGLIDKLKSEQAGNAPTPPAAAPTAPQAKEQGASPVAREHFEKAKNIITKYPAKEAARLWSSGEWNDAKHDEWIEADETVKQEEKLKRAKVAEKYKKPGE
jgi:hypothetical protein